MLLGLIVLGAQLSPVFLSPRNFANLLAALMEVAIMAVPMTLVIIAGEIDLSVESMAGLACAVARLPVGGRRPDLDRRRLLVIVLGALGGADERDAGRAVRRCPRSSSPSGRWPCSAASR